MLREENVRPMKFIDVSNHDWDCFYKCKRCGIEYMESIDNPNSGLPEKGCKVVNIEDHFAFVCECGSVKFNLLKSGKIECHECKQLTIFNWQG